MVPDFGHLVPVVNNTMFNGVVDFEDTFFGLGFLSDIDIFIAHANHDVVVLGDTNYGWEGRSRCIVP